MVRNAYGVETQRLTEDPFVQCEAITIKGTRCKIPAIPGEKFCGFHKRYNERQAKQKRFEAEREAYRKEKAEISRMLTGSIISEFMKHEFNCIIPCGQIKYHTKHNKTLLKDEIVSRLGNDIVDILVIAIRNFR